MDESVKEIYMFRRHLRTYTVQKIGNTSYLVISQYDGEKNILEKLGDIIAEDYEQQRDFPEKI